MPPVRDLGGFLPTSRPSPYLLAGLLCRRLLLGWLLPRRFFPGSLFLGRLLPGLLLRDRLLMGDRQLFDQRRVDSMLL